MYSFYEFFAGGGMVRLGLGESWKCIFANDFCPKKAACYFANFPLAKELTIRDIRSLSAHDLPRSPHLAWASFPCQDLSLAGAGKGLRGERSGTFHDFIRLMYEKSVNGDKVPLLVLENVTGTIRSNNGNDFKAILQCLSENGYRFGAMVIDASYFLPQSRPRLFVVAIDDQLSIPDGFTTDAEASPWITSALRAACQSLPASIKERLVWWNLPSPERRKRKLSDVIERQDVPVKWHDSVTTNRILDMMSETNRAKVSLAQESQRLQIGTIYKRTRINEYGQRVQRAEVRFDQVSGCLRTPAGGSSRQTLILVRGSEIRTRLITSREAARLMGLPDCYHLPKNYNEAYHLVGDGVAVPVVEHLSRNLLLPLAELSVKRSRHQRRREKQIA